MTLDETIRHLELAREIHGGDIQIMIAHASGNLRQDVSGRFPLLQIVTNDHGVTLVQSNYLSNYIPVVFPDSPPQQWTKED